MRNLFVLLLAFTLSGFSWAEKSIEYVEGIEYEVLDKVQPAPADGKVEVIEFFSYACPHCYRFEPHIEKWLEHKPDNVVFKQVPAIFNKNWEARFEAGFIGRQSFLFNVNRRFGFIKKRTL